MAVPSIDAVRSALGLEPLTKPSEALVKGAVARGRRPDRALAVSLDDARAALGLPPLTAAFHMSPEELAEKARQQTRDSEGKFVEEAPTKATLPEGLEPVGETPVEPSASASTAPPQPEPEVATPPPPPEPEAAVAESGYRTRYDEARQNLPKDIRHFGHRDRNGPLPDFYVPDDDPATRLIEELEEVDYDLEELDPDVSQEISDRFGSDLWNVEYDLEDADEDEQRAEKERIASTWISESSKAEAREEAEFRMEGDAGYRGGPTILDVYGRYSGGAEVMGPAVMEHLNALLEAGAVLDEELERRIQARRSEAQLDYDPQERLAELREQHVEAGAKLEQARQAGASENDADVVMARFRVEGYERMIRNTLIDAEQQESETLIPGSSAYAAVQREEAIKLLAEVRPMGGVPRVNTADIPEEEKQAVADSLATMAEAYPTDWLADISQRGVRVGLSDRAFYQESDGYLALSVDGSDKGGRYSEAATHEFGHTVEEVRSHIRLIEWAMSHHRSPRDEDTRQQTLPGEYAYFDSWANPYSGIAYQGTRHAPWEILTTGLEALLEGGAYFTRADESGGFDKEFRALILALLAEA